jgi:hypothetical protein
VKKQVISVLQGERAYKDFIAKAQEIRAAVEKLGPGGLKQWVEQDAAKVWEAKLMTNTIDSTQKIAPPPSEINGLAAEEAKLVAAMAMPDRPVVLGTSPTQDEIPAVRLVQVSAYQPAMPASGNKRVEYANLYRRMLEGYRDGIFSKKLMAELQEH